MIEKFIEPKIEVINIKTTNVIATSGGMVNAIVSGVASYSTQISGMLGGTIGGTAFNDQ